MIASITSSVQEFCKIQRINSVFNIDEDIYVVDRDVRKFWRYDSKINDFKDDAQIETIASNLTFKGISHSIVSKFLIIFYVFSQ